MQFLKQSIQIGNKESIPSVHKLKLRTEKLDGDGHLQKCTFGEAKTVYNDKVIMLLGATGSGKTTLINWIANYILGVQWEDEFRFKLVNEESKRTQAESQTSSVTSYHLIHQEGFQVPYNLTIIDTPGFEDTRWIDGDVFLVEQIREFFSVPGGVDHLDAVCFVAPSSLAQLTRTQRYVFDSILSIFGKDMADNLLLLVTFADNQKPPVLETITAAKMLCPKDNGLPVHFKFNNSALFAYNGAIGDMEGEDDKNFDKMFWKMGVNSLKKLFMALNKLETKSLCLNKEVFDKRRHLEFVVEDLQPQIRAGLTEHEEIRNRKAVLEKNRDKMKANENFQYQVSKTVAKKEAVDKFITNCQKCQHTCHYPCQIAEDAEKHGCAAMDENKNCRMCPRKCIWSVHFNNNYKWIYETVIEIGTYEDLKGNGEKAHWDVTTAEGIFQQLNEELAGVEEKVVDLIVRLSMCLQRLEGIAQKPNPISTAEYIDILIDSEKNGANPGYKERIQSLKAMKERAVLRSISNRNEPVMQAQVPSSSVETGLKGSSTTGQNPIMHLTGILNYLPDSTTCTFEDFCFIIIIIIISIIIMTFKI